MKYHAFFVIFEKNNKIAANYRWRLKGYYAYVGRREDLNAQLVCRLF